MLISLRLALPRRANRLAHLAAIATTCATRLMDMRRAAQGRRAIAQMDARMLSDIGLTRTEAAVEAARPFWDTRPTLKRR